MRCRHLSIHGQLEILNLLDAAELKVALDRSQTCITTHKDAWKLISLL